MKRTTSFLAKASMMLLAVLFSLTGARAQNELTVYDGADQTSGVPFRGHYADYGTRSQFIIPAIELNEMAGRSINKLTFYAAAESANFDEGVTVYLKEVDYSTFESEAMENWDEMTEVYTGNIAVSDYTMEIEFDSPYTYGGKNLMIGLQVTTWGSLCPDFKWYGENQAEGSYTAVYNNANSSHEWGSTSTRITFIPKTTFSLTGARAQNELTVYDGADQTSGVPFRGHYADYGTRSQFIIPAIELNEMAGGSINKLTFYAAAESANFDEGVTVYLKEVDYSTFESEAMENWDEMTEVYTGNIAVSDYTMEIEFDSPYTYGGKNLMIGFQVTTWGSLCSDFKWYGENQAEGSYTAVYNNANSSHEWGSTSTRITFIPKTTFTYTAGGGLIVERPQTFEVSGITSSEAVLTWTGGTGTYNVEYKKAAETDWTTAITNTTAKTFTLTGLEPLTAYQARVQSVSGSDVSGWKKVEFNTASGFPYIEDFTAGLPATWTRYTGLLDDILGGATLATTTSRWKVGTDNSVLDDAHALANIYGTGTQHWLVTPAILLPANAQIAFDVAYTAYNGTAADPAQNGEDDKFVVLISTDDMATWTILRQWDNAGSPFVLNNLTPAGENVAISLEAYAGQNVNVAFYVESTASNADNNLHIDNVAFQEKTAVVCEKPIGLKVNYDGGTEATVSWVSEEPYFDIDVNGTITEDVENPYTLTNLELATTYSIKVRARNGSGVSDWAGPVSFATKISDDMCQIQLILVDSWGDGWNGGAAIQIADVATGIVIGTYANQNLDGTNGIETNTLYASVPNDRDIQFSWITGSYDDECSYTAYDVNGEEIFSGSGAMTAPVTYHVDCVVSPFRTPTDLAASEITKNSVTLSWTEKGTATEWVINVYDETNDDSFGEFTTSENPFTLTGLTPETEYTAVVRPAGENEKWSTPISFTTDVAFPAPTELAVDKVKATSAEISWTGDADASSYNLRYVTSNSAGGFFDDFENGLDDWTLIVNAEGTGWQTFDVTQFSGFSNYSGNHVAMARSYEGGEDITADNWMITPQITIGNTMTYWARNDGYENHQYDETYDVCVSTGSNNPEDFVIVQTFTTTPYEWEQITIDLSAYYGQQGYVAFHHHDAGKDVLLIDDVTIVSFTGDTEESWTTINNVTSPYTIGGLAPETMCLVQVQAVYEDGESQWTETSFTTKGYLDVPTDLTADVAYTSATLSWEGAQDSYNLRYRSAAASAPSIPATIILEAHDVWGDGSGYQMLLDADANTYGTLWDELHHIYYVNGEQYSGGDLSEEYYYDFEYKNPAEADGSLSTTNVVVDGSITINIPAGTYDYVILNPTPGDKFYIATDNGEVGGAEDNFVFEPGVTYHFTMGKFGSYDGAALEIIRDWSEWTEVDNIADTSYLLTGLTPGTKHEWQVQGIYSGSTTDWSEAATFTTKELLELADNATDNSAIIAANNGKVADVQLTGRTLFKDGEWNTICLPFALNATELAASPLADGDIRTLDNIAVVGTTAALNFTAEGAVTEIEAGKPYLIRWTSGKHIVSPTFNNVVVNKTMNDVVCTAGETAVTFKGNYDKMIYSEDNTSVLFFDDDNNLDYPLAGTSIGALRGYFQLAGLTADGIEFVTNLNVYDPDGISLTPALSEGEGDWYDLGGRKLAGKPTMKGIYVNGGRKVTIK